MQIATVESIRQVPQGGGVGRVEFEGRAVHVVQELGHVSGREGRHVHVHLVLQGCAAVGASASAAQLAAVVAADVAVLPTRHHVVVGPPAESLAAPAVVVGTAVAIAVAASPRPPPLTTNVLGDESRLPPPVREEEGVGVVRRGPAVVPASVVHVQGQVAAGSEGVRPPIEPAGVVAPPPVAAAEGGADVGYAIHRRHVRAADLRVEGLERSHFGI